MKYIKGIDRNQVAIFPVSMNESIDKNHEIRFIDFFVDSLDLEKIGFSLNAQEKSLFLGGSLLLFLKWFGRVSITFIIVPQHL